MVGFLFAVALFSVVLQTKIVAGDRAEFFFAVRAEGAQHKFVKRVGEIEHFVALVLDDANLWQAVDLVSAGAGSVVNVFLILRHALDVFLQRDELVFRGGVEEQEILQLVLKRAVAVVEADLDVAAEGFEKFFVLLGGRCRAFGSARG